VKTNSSGNVLWQKCFGGSSQDRSWEAILTNDGITITNFLNVDGTFISTAGSIFSIQSVNNVSINNGKLAQCIKGIYADNVSFFRK
jgi:hypothetical protein